MPVLNSRDLFYEITAIFAGTSSKLFHLMKSGISASTRAKLPLHQSVLARGM